MQTDSLRGSTSTTFLMRVSEVVGSAATYIALFTAHDLALCTAIFLKISFSCKFHHPHTTTDGGASRCVIRSKPRFSPTASKFSNNWSTYVERTLFAFSTQVFLYSKSMYSILTLLGTTKAVMGMIFFESNVHFLLGIAACSYFTAGGMVGTV